MTIPSLQSLCLIAHRRRLAPAPAPAKLVVVVPIPAAVPSLPDLASMAITPKQSLRPGPVPKTARQNNWPERVILIDTETTGLLPTDRVVEVAAILMEMDGDGVMRERGVFHHYCNPGVKSHPRALAVHKLEDNWLAAQPPFPAQEFLEFIGRHPIITHNAAFDMRFLNREMVKAGMSAIPNMALCTLKSARSFLPVGSHRLDDLCIRFGISLESRAAAHGALVDARLIIPLLSFIPNQV